MPVEDSASRVEALREKGAAIVTERDIYAIYGRMYAQLDFSEDKINSKNGVLMRSVGRSVAKFIYRARSLEGLVVWVSSGFMTRIPSSLLLLLLLLRLLLLLPLFCSDLHI